jgi:hypothetical protein
MLEEISRIIPLSSDEKALLDILRKTPGLMDCFMEMAEIADNKVEDLNRHEKTIVEFDGGMVPL